MVCQKTHREVSYIFCLLLFFSFSSLNSTPLFSSDPYPTDWWRPFPRESAPSWEILPQEATYGIDVILSKRTDLGIFSNFAKTPFKLDGKEYASIEGFWQMMKYPDPDDRSDPRHRPDLIWKYTREGVSQLSGFDAKRAGEATKENYEKLGIKWISYRGKRMEYKGKDQMEHYQLIFRATQAKIDENPKAKELLMKTGSLILRPDHQQSPDATPAYRYHEILMRIRQGRQTSSLGWSGLYSYCAPFPSEMGLRLSNRKIPKCLNLLTVHHRMINRRFFGHLGQ